MKRKKIIEAEMTLQSVKAKSPEKTGEMPSKYKLIWTEFNNDGEVVEKNKSFESLEKFEEFKLELESKPDFLEIQRIEKPNFMDKMPAAKSEKMEKVKLKEFVMRDVEKKIRRLIEVAVRRELNEVFKRERSKQRFMKHLQTFEYFLNESSDNLIDYSKILKVGDIVLIRNNQKMKVVKIDKTNSDRSIYLEEIYFERDRMQRGLTYNSKSQEWILTKFGKWDNNRDTELDIISVVNK